MDIILICDINRFNVITIQIYTKKFTENLIRKPFSYIQIIVKRKKKKNISKQKLISTQNRHLSALIICNYLQYILTARFKMIKKY